MATQDTTILQLTVESSCLFHDSIECNAALLDVLKARTQTSWRWASANVAVEKAQPYRVAVLSGQGWRTWCDWCNDPHAHDCQLTIALYTPLA